MKKSDITPKIIELSKEIAKYWKMEIRKGIWYLQEARDNSELFLFYYLGITTTSEMENILNKGKERNLWKVTPIPSISDIMYQIRHISLIPKNEIFIYEKFQD